MSFPVTGLQAMVDDCITRKGATSLGAMSADSAFIRGYAWGAKYGMPLDHTSLSTLNTKLATLGYLDAAVALQVTLNSVTATNTANDTARAAADTADAAAVTTAQAAVDAYNP